MLEKSSFHVNQTTETGIILQLTIFPSILRSDHLMYPRLGGLFHLPRLSVQKN